MDAHVLSVGQCGADDARLARVLSVEADAHMDRAATAEQARSLIAQRRFDLILVNRIIEDDGQSGVDFIGEMKQADGSLCLMLISDYADAQAEALAKGAARGFGKSQIGSAEVGQHLREALHSCARAGLMEKVAVVSKK